MSALNVMGMTFDQAASSEEKDLCAATSQYDIKEPKCLAQELAGIKEK